MFPLPPPHFHTHALDNTQYPTILVHFREILIKAQQKATPKITRQSCVEETDQPKGPSIRKLTSSIEESIESLDESSLPNGHHNMTNGDSHMTDHMTNSSSIPDEEEDTISATISQNSCPSSPLKTLASSTNEDPILTESGERESQDSTTSPIRPKQPLERRQTYSQGMIGSSRSNSLTVTAAGSPGLRRYPSMSGGTPSPRSMSISGSPLVSLRTQLKRKSTSYNLSVRRQSRKTSTTILSPTHKPNLKLVKVVLAGNDIMVSHTAKAYAHLRTDEPNLFSGLDIRFYHVPLSRASTIYGIEMGGVSVGSTPRASPELPEPMMEQYNMSGNDVHIGRFLAHMDSWYERNLMIAVHHLLRLLPAVSCWGCGQCVGCCLIVHVYMYIQDVPYNPQQSKSVDGRAMSPLATDGDGSHGNRGAVTPAKVSHFELRR